MSRTRTAVAQPGSAQRAVAAAGIRHDDVVNAQVIVGVTPASPAKDAKHPAQPQTAHFCSSRIVDPVIERHGDGQPVPVDGEYVVVIRDGLPQVPAPGLLRIRATICANGQLTLSQRTSKARFVPTPKALQESVPHARADGPDDLVRAYGCRSVQELFDRHGCDLVTA